MLLIYWFTDWYESWGKSMILTLEAMLKDLFLWIFEQILKLSAITLEATGDAFDGLNIANYISELPPEPAWVLNQIGVGQAMGIIIAAVIIRIILQLIPFTRLGS